MSEGEDFVCLTEADIIAEQSREIENVSEVYALHYDPAIRRCLCVLTRILCVW
jgi:hypothetical protein